MAYRVIKDGATVGTSQGTRVDILTREDVPHVNKKVYRAGEYVEEPIDPRWAEGLENDDPEYTEWVIEEDLPDPTFDEAEVAAAVEASEAPAGDDRSIDEVLAEQEAQRESDRAELVAEYDVKLEAAEAQTATIAEDRDGIANALEAAQARIAELEKELEDATASVPAPAGGDPPAGADAGAEDKPYDPNDHTVAQIQEYLGTASPEEQERVLVAERAGQNRAAFRAEAS